MKTNLLNSLLLHWSFENAEIVNEGVSTISSINLSGFVKPNQSKIEEDATCLCVMYPLYLEVYNDVNMTLVQLKEEQDFAAFLAEVDEDLLVRLNFPLRIIVNKKEKVMATEEEFLMTLSDQLNNLGEPSRATYYAKNIGEMNYASTPYIFR